MFYNFMDTQEIEMSLMTVQSGDHDQTRVRKRQLETGSPDRVSEKKKNQKK